MSNQTIDFSHLTNDQLVALVRAACAEAVNRGAATEAATRDAMLSEAEKAQIARDAEAKAAEALRAQEAERIRKQAEEETKRRAEGDKQQRQWGMQKTLAQMVEHVLGSDCTLNVWQKDAEKRVYIDKGGVGRRSDAAIRIEYYVTGNSYNPPKTLKTSGSALDKSKEEKEMIRRIVEKAAAEWSSMRMECNQAAKANVPAVGEVPADMIAYGEAWRRKQAEAEAAATAERERKAEEERQAREARRIADEKAKQERQDKLRALLGGAPVLAKTAVLVCPLVPDIKSDGTENEYRCKDNGRRTVVVARMGEAPHTLRVVYIEITSTGWDASSKKIALGGEIENPRPHFTPEEWAALTDPARLSALPEIERDTLARLSTDNTEKPFKNFMGKRLWSGKDEYHRPTDLPAPQVEVTA